mmetsp:Transcript_5769/g.13689  ORF Transcript_5769/g.13689 Transcript_5769/m.13689 type:complete len:229 (+) Transcript_5769:86-772(+)
MGARQSLSKLWKAPPAKVLMVGLDAAGKTTILYKLQIGEVVNTIPTIGFNVETVSTNKLELLTWDVGGRDKIRPLWRHYLQKVQAIVFVVDCNDRDEDRLESALKELWWILDEDDAKHAPLLVFANKQDLPNAMTTVEVAEKMRLHEMRERKWFVQESVATEKKGLFEGFEWLAAVLSKTDMAAAGNKAEQQLNKSEDKVEPKAEASLLESVVQRHLTARLKTLTNLL